MAVYIFFPYVNALDELKRDPEAFIFTLKNPHNIPPTRYNRREGSKYAIDCNLDTGPVFRDGTFPGSDIHICDNCDSPMSCSTENDGTRGYECDPTFKKSLFVNSSGAEEINMFSVFEYEVYCIDYEDRRTVFNLCEYPDVIWTYLLIKAIPEFQLQQFSDDTYLLNDLNTIRNRDITIKHTLSNYYLKHRSILLPGSTIVDVQYDNILLRWLKHKEWKLIFRASEHDYSAESFHKCCDNQGTTIVVVKSTCGWIFGGYTTKSWKCYPQYKRIKSSLLLTLH